MFFKQLRKQFHILKYLRIYFTQFIKQYHAVTFCHMKLFLFQAGLVVSSPLGLETSARSIPTYLCSSLEPLLF